MSNNSQYTWESNKLVDDVGYSQKDRDAFLNLLSSSKDAPDDDKLAVIPGKILKGRIVEITKDHVIVDVGLKSEGIVPISEFSDPLQLILDAEVEVFLDQAEDSHGQIVLSREKAERLRQWEFILQHCKEGSIVRGKVIRKVKGGLMVDIGVEAFLPGSQIDNKRIKNLDEYLDKIYEFKILKINIDRKNIVVSRRELLEAERISKKAELLENIRVNDVRFGIVKNITDFGVFLDLDGIDGLLHITDMTWRRIKHPSEMVQLGQKVEVMILSVDKEKGRVALGLKQKEENPWDQIEEKYPPGTHVKGKITNLLPYGAFMEIEAGIEGLIHVSEMSWVKNVADPSEVVQRGQELEAVVLSVQKQEGKISLGLKQLEHNPWDDIEKKYPIGTNVNAEIKSLTNYGAFVELEPGVEGLIHISDLSWIKKVSHPSEVLKKGDLVESVVLSVDKENKKITLGVKQLGQNPWETIGKTMPVGSMVQGKISKITAFGAFVELDNGIEGLIHVTELSDKPFGKIEDVVARGDDIKAKVIKLDPENKKIALSIKEFLIESNQFSHDDIVVSGSKSAQKRKTKPKQDALAAELDALEAQAQEQEVE
ncbi:MAG: 30S ribosomal protein S1 [Chlamydiales bacterium]|nr:30S ribosomal protein S1 [Chlamydiales bacterium]